jgi:hypothetical protein
VSALGVVSVRSAGMPGTSAGADLAGPAAARLSDGRLQAPATDRARYSVAGVKMRGQPVQMQNVTDINATTGHAQTGELMWGRTHQGVALFWIKGSGKHTILRGADGKTVTDATTALARAGE